jgi:hypothetical protein
MVLYVLSQIFVNVLTKSDNYPISQIEDCVDKEGHSKFVSKFDLRCLPFARPMVCGSIESCPLG